MKPLRSIVPLQENIELYEDCNEENFDRYVQNTKELLSSFTKYLKKYEALVKENNKNSSYYDIYSIKELYRDFENAYDRLISATESQERTAKYNQNNSTEVRNY